MSVEGTGLELNWRSRAVARLVKINCHGAVGLAVTGKCRTRVGNKEKWMDGIQPGHPGPRDQRKAGTHGTIGKSLPVRYLINSEWPGPRSVVVAIAIAVLGILPFMGSG